MSWDRDYFAPTDSLERRRTLTWILIGSFAAVFALQFVWNDLVFRASLAHRGQLERLFALSPALVVDKLHLWQVATSMFLSHDLWQLFFAILTLYFFAKMVEEALFIRKFAVLFFGGGLVAAVVFIGVGYVVKPGDAVVGCDGALMGVLAFAGLSWPDMRVIFYFFPIRLKYLVLILIAFDAYITIHSFGVAALSHLAGAAWGALFWKFHDRVTERLESMDARHEDASRRKEEKAELELDGEVDRILAKISQEGIDALTSREKRTLDQASRRKRSR